MGFFDERDTPDGLSVRLFVTRRDLQAALAGKITLSHADDDAEDAGAVHHIILTIAPEPASGHAATPRPVLHSVPPVRAA